MNNYNQNILSQIKQNPINEFYTEFCGGIKYKTAKDKYNCIFCDSTDNMAYNKNGNYMHCFGCGSTCDHINLIKDMKNTNFIESIKIVADYYGYEHKINEKETTTETSKEIQERKEKFQIEKDSS